jgi:hypothetical protein
MAADQRITDAGPIAHILKIKRIADSLYGLCGEISPGLVFFKWFESGKRDIPRLHKMIAEDSRYNFSVIELGPSGLALWDGWGVRIPLLDKIFAVGTGAQAALAAVEEHGKTPEEAVRIAMRRDECSGLFKEPQVEWLLPPELKRKR